MGLRSLVIVLSAAWLFGTSPVAEAVMLHTFDCNNCHKAGTSYTALDGNNVCLSCHNKPITGVHFNNDLLTDPDRKSDAGFVIGDATNALGSYPAGVTEGKQNSHYWAAQKDVNAAAGAEAPVAIQFYSRNGTSTGKVTCSRCHNPHGDSTQPQLLRMATAEAVCKACHLSWYAGAGNLGHLTHPLPSLADGTYASFVADGTGRFRAIPAFDPAVSSSVTMLPDGTMGCTSCHGAHFTDSDGTTPDGPLAIQGNGDGRMLRGNGALITDADPALQAQKRSNLCQSCHTYQLHGSGNPIGCLDCHSGHSYNGGNPNFFVLRSEATDIPMPKAGGAIQSVSGLVYNSATFNWLDVGGNGYCQNCHAIPVDGNGKHNGLDAGSMTDCVGCHGHGNSEVSFGGSCNSCHGYPPADDTASGTTGYAVDPNAGAGFINGYKFLDNGSTLRAVYKNETNTPHLAHAGIGAGEYGIACEECHVATFPVDLGTHPNQSFQDVTFDVFAATGMAGTAYNTANPGTCSNIYCHSNGGARAAAPVAATIPGWANGSTTGAITTCDACHGNSAATMTTKSNSGGHQMHLGAGAILGKTYGCAVCHDQTAIDKDTLSATAIGGTHVDGQKDVLVTANLLGVTDLGLSAVVGTDGSCQSIYCHSDGKGNYKTPDWDNAPSVACNTCHDNTGASLSGAHQRHILDADGPGLSCDACHPAGANTGAHSGHIDGTLDKPTDAVCAACHGATVGVTTGVDREPQWLIFTSVDCQTCHAGVQSVINGRTAPLKDVFGTSGHGKTGVTKACLDCHDGAGSGHFDATPGDNRLLTLGGGYSAATPEGFCAACHTGTTETDHYGNGGSGGSLDGNHCNSCHDPHGAGLDAMILSNIGGRDVVGFASKGTREDYYVLTPNNAGNNQYGICQVCHEPTDVSAPGGDIKYFNTTTSTPGHYAGVCTDCHKHDSTTAFTPSGCNGCHGDSGTGQYWPFGSGGSIPTANDDMGRHDEHVLLIGQSLGYGSYSPTMYSDAQQKAICAYCHATPGADGDHGNVLSLPADTAFHPLWNVGAAAAGTYDTAGDVQGTCSNIACHNSKATGSSTNAGNLTTFGWKDAGTATCILCHTNVTDGAVANSTGGTHVAHTGAQGTYGVTIDCATCHDSATVWNATKPADGHLNGTLNVNAPLSYIAGSCGTNDCHNDGTLTGAPAVTTYAWGNAEASACNICHDATPATGKHGKHVGSSTYVANSCNDCHDTNTGNALAAAAEPTHLNTVVNTANKVSAYNGSPAFTCTNACHTADTTDDWSATGSLACTDCHGSGIVTTPALDRGWPPTTVRTAAHTAHTDNSGYVSANCVDCHNNNVGAHSTLDNSVTSPTLGAKVSAYNSVAGTCTNTCHAGGADFHDSTPAPVCTDCHTSGMIGTIPASGLHATTVALAHDVSFGAGGTCDSCHAATPTTTHIQGGAAQTSLQTTYNFNGTNVVSYGSAAGCAANCHSDAVANLGVGKWYRKWIGVTDAKPLATDSPGAAVCDNCHGDGIDKANGTSVDNLWNAGLDPVHGDADGNNGIEMIGQHAKCETCHGYGNDALYDRNWNTGSPGHGDGSISMNGPDAAHGPVAGAQYDEDAFGCLAACHSGSLTNSGDANFNHALADSTWPVNYGNYGSGDCDTCHAAAVPPRDHGDVASENSGLHATHVASGYVTDCTACHPHDGVSVAPGTGVHGTGTVNFTGQMLGATDYSASAFGGTCATANGCHDSAAGEWAAGTLGNGCIDCHSAGGKLLDQGGYPPTSNEHGSHLGNDAIFAPATDCDKCHGGGAVTGTHIGHKNNGASINLDAAVITAYNGTNCANTCHTSAASAWTSGVATLNCTDCHNLSGNTLGTPVHATLSSTVGPTGDKHAAHLANSSFVPDCATCHTHNGALGNYATSGHVNGLNPTVVGTLTVNGNKSCANDCHSAPDVNEWISGALVCTDCHSAVGKLLNGGGESDLSASVGPNAGRHDEHMASTNYVTSGCTDCHGHSGSLVVSSHVDGSKTVASKVTAYAAGGCTNSCHDVNVAGSGDWADSNALACADCHAANVAKDLGNGAWPPVSNAHSEHFVSNALPGLVEQNECYACHDSTIDNTGALKVAGTHLNLTSGDLGFNSSFNYEAGTAGRAAGAAATTTCATVLCHNGVTTPTWGAVTISCGQCHNTPGRGPIPSGSIGGSHLAHVDSNDGDFVDCENCHTGANSYSATGGPATHQNLTVNLNRSYTDGNGAAGVNYAGDGVDNGTCSAVDCHGGTVTPAWGGTFAGYKCTWCHNDGTVAQGAGVLNNAVPTATKDIHGRHVVDAATAYVDDCNACHGATASTGTHTGHANQAITYGNSLAGYSGTNCTTNLCHDDAAGNLWVNAATLTCGDCHAATGKTLAFGNTAVSATVPPADGKHTNHMGNFYVGTAGDRCTVCHTHVGSFAVAGHADAAAAITLDTASGEQITYAAGNCTNNCHNVAGGGWTGAVTLVCSDCHSGATYVASRPKSLATQFPPTNNGHSAHVSTGDGSYGLLTRKAAVGSYDFACGQCHGTTAGNHMNGSITMAAVGFSAATANACNATSCHSDGRGSNVESPIWSGTFAGDRCAGCHGNSPTSSAHGVHEIGIHSEDIYDQANSGVMTAANGAHGERTTDNLQRTSTIITCQVCHNGTVQVSNNDKNTTCAGCHTASAKGDMVIGTYDNHVNGAADILFFNEAVKTKAQLRNDIEDPSVTEIGSNWKRMNDGIFQNLFYKGANAYDQSETLLNAQGTAGSGATRNCTVACHNGRVANWPTSYINPASYASDCSACHTQLPK
jgi:predicted CxxxxCH...CXXCH cytochrome family protein